MFQLFLKKLHLHNLKLKTNQLISFDQKVFLIISHPRMWMFLVGLLLVGITLLSVKPEFAKDVSESFPITEAHASKAVVLSPETIQLVKSDTMLSKSEGEYSKLDELKQKRRVAAWISKRYRIANKASNFFVTAAYKTAFEIDLDPHLILAVVAIESRFNPYAESSMGAQGLMQVMSKVHAKRFKDHGGIQYALDPEVNIKVGAKILKEYVKQKGSVELALKSYVGAATTSHDSGYGNRVINEYRKLKAIASGSKTPILVQSRSRHSVRQKRIIDTKSLAKAVQHESRIKDDSALL